MLLNDNVANRPVPEVNTWALSYFKDSSRTDKVFVEIEGTNEAVNETARLISKGCRWGGVCLAVNGHELEHGNYVAVYNNGVRFEPTSADCE